MPSINYQELMNAIKADKVDVDTLFRVEYGSISENKKDLVYFKIKWNSKFADSKAEPEYVPAWDMHIDEDCEVKYNAVIENKHDTKSDKTGKDTTTWYFSKRVSKKSDPTFFSTFEFIDNAFRAALKALKVSIEEKFGTSTKDMNADTKLIYNIVKQDIDDVFKGYIMYTRLDKKTNKQVPLDDPYVSINFDFNTWHPKLKQLAGKQISRVAFLKTEEELKAGNADIKYKLRKINGDHNRPQSVYKHSAGSFWGDINFPGKMYTNAGEVKLNMTFGFIFVSPDAKSPDAKSGGMNNPESLCESYDDDDASSKLKAASRTLVESESEESEEEEKPKKKKQQKKKQESESEDSEEDKKPKKKQAAKQKKKVPEPEEESSESEYDSE